MTEFREKLERHITIRATRDAVFAYFTDSPRFARWWGEGSSIEPVVGGAVEIRYPNGVKARGTVVEIEPPARIAFSYGYGAGDPAAFSLVTISLEETPGGTALHLVHAFTSAKIRDQHVQGWRYQLALFSKTVSDESAREVEAAVDAFLAAWGDPDPAARRRRLESCAARGIAFRDAYSATDGLEDLLANLEAIQVHMSGERPAREGPVLLSHGTAIARWAASKDGGEALGRGTNVYDFAPDGTITRVVGFRES